MNRLQAELQRLYPPPSTTQEGDRVRALLLELARPADWDTLGQLWRGVQADLQLPAPGIAVSGTDGLQLWFSLQQPVSAARAADFLARLQARYLPGIAPARVRALATVPAIPAQDAATGNWSAFVAPDLAPVFADTPWLDIPPGADGQADLLARLAPIKPAAFEAAMQALAPAAAPRPDAGTDVNPRQFLQRVLNDETAPLALRVDAAKALLGREP
ncbi:hypothetical protein [Roseateles asaccharophilus]|uniref:DUF721 domain-containing protein n=1 Tax=Roseateles asaccharophilus TaxID=582607 RepID=A0ABU2A920_9BURK|nr:hypothetical protein [Roseateles asaccharophilus]MDR7333500.1 hypothetical protein [Roseateles asaccharophilus]